VQAGGRVVERQHTLLTQKCKECFIRELLKQRPSLFTCPADFVPAQVQHLDDLMLAMMGAADLGGCTLIHLVVFPLFKSATFCVDFVLILVLI